MSRMRQGYLLRGFAIFIVALFSGAWTFSVAGVGGLSVTADEPTAPGGLPDGSSVPTEAIDNPASVSDAATVDGADNGNTAKIVAASSTNSIPAAALAAYQRAETVINKADPKCNLTWQLVAAIGRVESNHGRSNGNSLDNKGVANPGIYGPALNGTGGTKSISDTDAGQFDNDAKWDRAVGPMQFIPSTWSVVGVDADDDAQRNPQDVDDSSLATAVFLCSGDDNLSTLSGQKKAIYRYNHSKPYVNLVIKIMDAYLDGDYSSVTGTTTAGGYVVPDPSYTPPPSYNTPPGTRTPGTNGGATNNGGSSGSLDNGSGGSTDNGGSTGGNNGGTNPGGGTDTGGTNPVQEGANKADENAGKVTAPLISGVLGLLTKAEAGPACRAKYPKLTQSVQLIACLVSYGLG